MKFIDSIPNTDKINYLNIGLLAISCLVAFFVPFELFLFSYAVLGPAHYLTEISWLHERKYFSNGKRDYLLLGAAAVLLFVAAYVLRPQKLMSGEMTLHFSTALVYIAFLAGLSMVLLKEPFQRFIAFIIICATSVIAKDFVLFFSVFLPTLIHVYVFTGLFMLYGALKARSTSGYWTFAIFLLCPILFFLVGTDGTAISEYALQAYPNFQVLNIESIKLWDIDIFGQFDPQINAVYQSSFGIILMRFIAFAYTYHYLNWFSKTTVIKWHEVPKKRLAIIAILWIASVAFYLYNYRLGFHVLFLLSFLHVFLEFPLNHVTIIGIGKEISAMRKGTQPAVAKGKRK
jgi:hypothetical protein